MSKIIDKIIGGGKPRQTIKDKQNKALSNYYLDKSVLLWRVRA